MNAKSVAAISDSKYATLYLLLLLLLMIIQPLVADVILFYAFMALAIISCFLPFNIPFPLFMSICVMALFLMDLHSPFRSNYVYLTSALGGGILIAVRLALVRMGNAGFQGSKAQLYAFWDTIVDGLIVIDDKALIVAANPAAEDLFGYTEEELLGQNVKLLMPHRYAVEHDGYVDAYNKTAQAKIIGSGREVEGKRKDGSKFPMYLAVSKFDEGGKRYYCGIVHDKTQEREIRQSLLQAKETAESASKAKTKFLSSISHEVRTPLNAILGFTQLLETTFEEGISDEQAEYISHIKKSGEHLLALVNEVLDMSQIEAGRFVISIERIDVASVLRECVEMAKPIAEKYEVKLSYTVEVPAGTAVRADRVRLKQALLNLSTNAVKYNQKGGSASWRVFVTSAGDIRFEITDTGLGIGKHQREAMFEPFNRLGREASTIEGTGIGLAVTKSVVDAMEGSIDFESTEGVGTKFWIDLPAVLRPHEDMVDDTLAGQGPNPAVPEGGHGTHTVLYVEDNPENALLMSRFIEKIARINLLQARTAQEGLEIARNRQVDLILMDLNLPGTDGFEAQLSLARDDRTRGIPVVAISADVNPATIKRAMNSGFRRFISKPFDLTEARQVIEETLQLPKS